MRPGHLNRGRGGPTGRMFGSVTQAVRTAGLLAALALGSCAGTPPPWVRNASDANPCATVSCPHGMSCDTSGHCQPDSPQH